MEKEKLKNIWPLFQDIGEAQFERKCLEIFHFQYNHIAVYQSFAKAINRHPTKVKKLKDIPFMPIEFFKNFSIFSSSNKPEAVFKSSGTTGLDRSSHFIQDLALYEESFFTAFRYFYGSIKDYVVLALLPSYIENGDSSLVYMTDHLIKASEDSDSGFYLNDYQLLIEKLQALQKNNKKILLLGVSYALLDLIELQDFQLPNMIVMETGGMKGRRKEMIREDLHAKLCKGFGVRKIHSEYGMTELLSQAYSKGGGLFSCPPWMKILIRDTNDPLSYMPQNKSGAINIIDLANVYSVSFLATQDLGNKYANGDFEVLGRYDNSDIRGCNLLVV